MAQTIDDRDPSHVVYSGNWVAGGTSNEFDNTVTSSTTVGDYFTVNFSGTSIGVFGTIDSTSRGVVTSYSVDGASASQATAGAATTDTYRQNFWTSPPLSSGVHSLVVQMVKVNGNSGPGEGTIWFDYFDVDITPVTPTSSTSSSPSTSPSSLPSNLSPPSPTPTAHKSNLGGIIGGAVGGGLGLIFLILLALFLFRRWQNKRDNALFDDGEGKFQTNHGNSSSLRLIPTHHDSVNTEIVPPSIRSHPPLSSNTSYASSQSNLHSNYQEKSQALTGFYVQNGAHDSMQPPNSNPSHISMQYPPSSSAAPVPTSSAPLPNNRINEKASPLILTWTPEPIQHMDSGVQIDQPKPVDLPPVYSANY